MKRLGLTTLVAVMIAFVMAPAVGATGTIDAPRNVSGSPTTDGVRISWNPVDGAGGYNVYRDGGYIATVSSPPFTEQISGAHRYYASRRATRTVEPCFGGARRVARLATTCIETTTMSRP